ncbi:MAG: N-acetylmuramoyl-L-alanine amidase [Myxococcota bacterium]
MKRSAQFVAVAAVVLALLGVDRPKNLGDVVDVRHWSYPDYTRVVIEFSRPVQSAVEYLSADPGAKRPERLYLDVDGIWVGRRYEAGVSVGDGLLRGIRLGQNTLERIRVVIDVDHFERYRLMTLTHPDRLVVDVYGHRSGGETLVWPSRGRRGGRLPSDLRPVRTVIIDPGHGGRDPGATGYQGLREKDVALRLARALGKELETKGFRVVYTREDDRTIGLEERTAIAEANRGDVFVSLHANSAPRRSVSGIETYYLDQENERHSLRVAARENGIDRDQVNELQKTLTRLRVSEASVQSRRLATFVHQQVVTGVGDKYGKIRDLGVKKGPFYVLFLSNMPAILVEAGFLTNRREARRLRNGDYLDGIAAQIATGLVRYRDEPPAVAMRAGR